MIAASSLLWELLPLPVFMAMLLAIQARARAGSLLPSPRVVLVVLREVGLAPPLGWDPRDG